MFCNYLAQDHGLARHNTSVKVLLWKNTKVKVFKVFKFYYLSLKGIENVLV